MTTGRDRPVVVFDVETRRHHEFDKRMGVEDNIAALEQMDLEQLVEFAEEHDIKLGNRAKLESVRPYIGQSLRKKADKAALKLYGCEVYAIGVRLLNGKAPALVWVVDELVYNEAAVLQAFFDYQRAMSDAPMLCGFNIREFDLPVVRIRAAYHGIQPPAMFPRDHREDTYDRNNVFDIRDTLSEGSLDDWLRMWSLPPKTGRGDMVQNMSQLEVRQYCADDVQREWLLARWILKTHPDHRHLVTEEA